MPSVKKGIEQFLSEKPDDISYEEMIRELAFELMVARGLKDSQKKDTISNEEMGHRIKQWQQ